MRAGKAGTEAKRLPKLSDRVGDAALGHQRDAQVVARVGVVGRTLHGSVEMVDRLGKPFLLAQYQAKIVVGCRIGRIDFQGLVELVNRFGLLPIPTHHLAEVVMRGHCRASWPPRLARWIARCDSPHCDDK